MSLGGLGPNIALEAAITKWNVCRFMDILYVLILLCKWRHSGWPILVLKNRGIFTIISITEKSICKGIIIGSLFYVILPYSDIGRKLSGQSLFYNFCTVFGLQWIRPDSLENWTYKLTRVIMPSLISNTKAIKTHLITTKHFKRIVESEK